MVAQVGKFALGNVYVCTVPFILTTIKLAAYFQNNREPHRVIVAEAPFHLIHLVCGLEIVL